MFVLSSDQMVAVGREDLWISFGLVFCRCFVLYFILFSVFFVFLHDPTSRVGIVVPQSPVPVLGQNAYPPPLRGALYISRGRTTFSDFG